MTPVAGMLKTLGLHLQPATAHVHQGQTQPARRYVSTVEWNI